MTLEQVIGNLLIISKRWPLLTWFLEMVVVTNLLIISKRWLLLSRFLEMVVVTTISLFCWWTLWFLKDLHVSILQRQGEAIWDGVENGHFIHTTVNNNVEQVKSKAHGMMMIRRKCYLTRRKRICFMLVVKQSIC